MRCAPSEADEKLLSSLAEADVAITAAQLERWRGWGLIPRAVVVRDAFGGSVVAEHDAEVVGACEVLAEVMRPSRPWQWGALTLFDLGFPLSTPAVQHTAAFLLERGLQRFRKAWRIAEAGAEPPGDDPIEWIADVATEAAKVAGRQARRDVREDVALLHPTLSQSALKEAAERALVWRLADMHAAPYLTEEQRTWARHGRDEPLDPLQGPPMPLPSERSACVTTLTWPESRLARAFIAQNSGADDRPQYLLSLATWRVTLWRLDEDFDHPERPLTSQVLHELKRDLDALTEKSADPADGGDAASGSSRSG